MIVREFSPLDKILLMAGCSFERSNRSHNYINIFMRISVSASFLSLFVTHFFLSPTWVKEPLTSIAIFTNALFGMLYMSIIIRKREDFVIILNQVTRLSENHRK